MTPLPSLSEDKDIWTDDDSEASFYEDESNAKLQRHMAKSRAFEAGMTEEEREQNRSTDTSTCGGVNVGNVNGPERGDVENIVIVRGDIINANNRCN